MKKNNIIILIITFYITISCSKKALVIEYFEVKKTDIMYGGMIVSVNPFQIEDENGKTYIRKRGGVGGINLKKPELDRLYDSDEKVTDSSNAILIIDYPLKKLIGYRIHNDKGFSKKDLVVLLSKKYSKIYSEKEKFEICCDEFSDLELQMIMVYKVNGEIYLESKVESKKQL